ncbi:hypothetical protein LCI18_014137 [Fusarium solani-melongenae]|uniref:Uncharacterized protein n=1 Tax=Fusarium solani subsp. cucurbitae TaxID=2747967 RepID=A0ACD3ZPS1_FUSSC|nr:hypothetical protein LCI18_014137 [Fusarium solani-melongenae]
MSQSPPIISESVSPRTHQIAKKACHSCRRARLRCDRSYPECTKCTSRGVECLGYGRLFLWTGAVATRGKLAGQSSSASVCRLPKQEDLTSFDAKGVGPEGWGMIRSHDNQVFYPTSQAPWHTTSPWPLVDPLFQDMSHSKRWYLNYFSSRVCLDLVAHDRPDNNPFRSLLLLTNEHPFLQEVIVAVSAAHMCNLARPWLGPDSFDRKEPPRQLLMDALKAKQQALQLMPSALENIDSIGADVILAAILFFVNAELVESGWQSWRPHLEGAKRLLNMMQPYASFSETLRDYVVSDFYVYCTLSLSFNPTMPGVQTAFFAPTQVNSTLSRATNHFFCCPADVLDILREAAQLLNTEGDKQVADDVMVSSFAALLKRAQNVDVLTWAREGVSPYDEAEIQSRFLTGSAHRLATCLYIIQSTPSLTERVPDKVCEALIRDIYDTLSPMPDDDPNFKATGWPTFIYGTTATTPELRAWVMDRLKRLVAVNPWGFLYSAIDTLQILWGLDAEGKRTTNWIQQLKDLNVDFLMV